MNKPNFFILGAARSGSTYLWSLLIQHPDIFLTTPKEPNFFCRPYQVVGNPVDYFELYDTAANESIRGEASHVYLSNPTSPGLLKALVPEARFVVVLRNPADRAYSLFHWMRRNGFESLDSFEEALACEEARMESKEFNESCPESIHNFMYFKSGLFGEQLSRYFEIYSKDRFHILRFDQLVGDPVACSKGIQRFLGVDEEFSPEVETGGNNSGQLTTRYPGLQTFVTTRMGGFRKLQKSCLKRLRKYNMKPIEPMSEKTRSELLERYRPDLELLHDLTGITFDDQQSK